LEKLNAAGTQITSLKGLPDSLLDLDISNNRQIESLHFLPEGLKSLDMRNTAIRSLNDLPTRLEVLKVSGPDIRDLKPLQALLRELYLENVKGQDFSDLPRTLEELQLTGASFDNLNGLPPFLRRLTLHSTKVRSLKGLLVPLQELTQLKLIENPMRFEASDLPERLTELKIDQKQGLGPADLSSLRYLHWLSDYRETPPTKLAPTLCSVTLNATNVSQRLKLPELPPSLRALGLFGASISIKTIPYGLENLSLTSYSGHTIGKLPSTLKRLSLIATTLPNSKLPDLPDSLEELVVIQTNLADLNGAPKGLKKLVFCETQVNRLNDLKDRFPRLQQLDLCNSGALREIGPLPKALKTLNISRTHISKLPDLEPDAILEELNISNTQIRLSSLKNLPRQLQSLTVSEGQIASWEGFPPHLQVLRFEGTVDTGEPQ